MKSSLFVGLAALCIASAIALELHEHNKVVCFWNSTSFERAGEGKFRVDDLRPALGLCTHLIYGFASIRATDHEVVPLHPNLDTGASHSFYRLVTQFKRSFPDLRVYLSVGGNADPHEETHKYLTVTETAETRNKFINSVSRLSNDYDFDGVDLAWQFPPAKENKKRGIFGSRWHGMEQTSGNAKFKDEKEAAHRDGFTALVRDLSSQLRSNNKTLTLTVLSHVNSSVYCDARLLAPNIDAVHFMTFDPKVAERVPNQAIYPVPLYDSSTRTVEDNIDVAVRYWLEHGIPREKIVIGIPTLGRTWSLVSSMSSVPPFITDGPGAEGPHTKEYGYL